MKPHKHAEVIKAWADGAKIQYRNPNSLRMVERDFWLDIVGGTPLWDTTFEYRVKPREFPKSSLTNMDLYALYNSETDHANGLQCVANAAIRRYILDEEAKSA